MITTTNKKGQGVLMALFVLMIIAFATVLIFASWQYMHHMLTDALSNSPSTAAVNITYATAITLGQVDLAMPELQWVSFAIIFGEVIFLLFMYWLNKIHPAFLVVFILVTIIAVIFSAYIANTYETLMQDPTLGTYITSHVASSWFMLYLPYIVSVVGTIGLVILVSGNIMDRGSGGFNV